MKSMLPRLAAFTSLGCLALAPTTAQAVQALLTDDTSTFSGSGGATYGDSGTLYLSTSRTPLFRFEIQSMLPAGVTAADIESAVLRVWVLGTIAGTGTITVHQMTQSWEEMTLGGVVPATSYDSTPIVSLAHTPFIRYDYVPIDLTNTVKSWVTTPSSNHGVIFKVSGNFSTTLGGKEGTYQHSILQINLKSGTKWTAGTSNPGSGFGADGDYFLNTTDRSFSGPKASGTWPAPIVLSLEGPKGPTGQRGPRGTDYLTLSGTDLMAWDPNNFYSWVVRGGVGETGDQGPAGFSGIQGEQGQVGASPQGPRGQSVALLGSPNNFSLDSVFYDGPEGQFYMAPYYGVNVDETLNLGDPVDLKGIKGETGNLGPIGDKGPDGPRGRTLLTGIGAPGNSYPGLRTGDQYLDLDTYQRRNYNGVWGTAVSLIGPKGTDGRVIRSGSGVPTAQTGLEGEFYLDTVASVLYGPKTTQGWGAGISLQGLPGDEGLPGLQGPTGPQGRSFLVGSGLPSGGQPGDLYLDLVAKVIYGPKTESWPTTGTSVAAPAGISLIGTAVPAPTLGEIGDFYFQTTTALTYGPKDVGGWGSGVSIVGPQGDAGDPGPAGPQTLLIKQSGDLLMATEFRNGPQPPNP